MTSKYRKYLQSDAWQKIREAVLERDKHTCQECGSASNLEIHHKTYKHIYHESKYLEDLVTLCSECHVPQHLSHIPKELLLEGVIDEAFQRVFTKIFRTPEFSKETYLSYWYRMCRHLSRDTNIIYTTKPQKHFISEIQEFENICRISKYVNYRFIKECRDKKYLATLKLTKQKVFVVNPTYAMNGNKIPVLLADLFDIETRNC